MRHDDATSGKRTHVHGTLSQQLGQNTRLHVAHVGGALHGELVARCLEHVREHVANLHERILGARATIDQLHHFALHVRVVDHGNMTREDFGLLGAYRLAHGVSLRVRVLDIACNGGLQALGFRRRVFHGMAGILQGRLLDDYDSANAQSGTGSDALQLH